MAKLKIKTGDTVKVIAGDQKGKEGKVVRVFIEKNRAIVEGELGVQTHQTKCPKPTRRNCKERGFS